MDHENDLLWPHFAPLWNDLVIRKPQILLVAGGYGLFLKQHYCLANPDISTAVPLDRWQNTAPRVTKDMDIVIDLEFIADEQLNRETCRILRKHGFTESDRPSGLRWQWMKELEKDRSVVVELHVPSPDPNNKMLISDGRRVKRKRSLRKDGIHGHDTPEAAGCTMGSFAFEADGIVIEVPNPITWTIMKLTAMRDRWKEHQKSTEEEQRRKFRDDAVKHGRDLCRIVALVSQEEQGRLSGVIDSISGTPQFQEAAKIQTQYFDGDRCWATDLVADDWSSGDLTTVRELLKSWYQLNIPTL